MRFLLFLFGLLWSIPSFAGDDYHADEGSALAHCGDAMSAYVAGRNASSGVPCGSGGSCENECIYTPSVGGASGPPGPAWKCTFTIAGPGTGVYQCDGYGQVAYHKFPAASTCDDLNPIGPLDPNSWGPADAGTSVCSIGCGFKVQYWCGASGVSLCSYWAIPTGESCTDEQDVTDSPPDGCTVTDGQLNCDCVNNPGAWFCANYSDPDNQEPPQGDDTGRDAGTGNDSDPDGNGESGDQGNSDNGCTADADGDGIDDVTGAICNGPGGGGGDSEYPGDGDGTPGGTLCGQTPPTCTTDSAQCALLIQSWEQNQDIYCSTEEGDPWDIPEGVIDPFDPENQETVDLSSESFDLSGDGGGSCPINPVLQLSSGSYELDISSVCLFAETMKPLIIAVTLLLSAMYVFRGI